MDHWRQRIKRPSSVTRYIQIPSETVCREHSWTVSALISNFQESEDPTVSQRHVGTSFSIWMNTLRTVVALTLLNSSLISAFQGDGTAYTLGSPSSGNCNIQSVRPTAKIYYAAMNNDQWNHYKTCGMCVSVRCIDSQCPEPRRSVTVQILDRCPECKHGDLDLSPEVFREITGSHPSRLKIDWDFVPCPRSFASGPMKFCLKGGSNGYWTAVQPCNTKTTVTKMTFNGKPAALNQMDAYYFLSTNGNGINLNQPIDIGVTTVAGNTANYKVVLGKAGNCFAPLGSAPRPAPTKPSATKPAPRPVPAKPAPKPSTTKPVPRPAPTKPAPKPSATKPAPRPVPKPSTAKPVVPSTAPRPAVSQVVLPSPDLDKDGAAEEEDEMDSQVIDLKKGSAIRVGLTWLSVAAVLLINFF